MHVFECVCMKKFRDKIILRGGECKIRENFKFKFKKKGGGGGGKTVIYHNSLEKIWDFSRSWMMKWIATLESSREI